MKVDEKLNEEKEQIVKQAEKIIKKLNKKYEEQEKVDISMWRVCAYFIIYSFLKWLYSVINIFCTGSLL